MPPGAARLVFLDKDQLNSNITYLSISNMYIYIYATLSKHIQKIFQSFLNLKAS